MKKKGMTFGSIFIILLTIIVLAGFFVLYATFHSDADVTMRAIKMAGLISDTILGTTPQPESAVKVTKVTLVPQPTNIPVSPAPAAVPAKREMAITLAGSVSFDSSISDSVYQKGQAICDYNDILSGIAPYVTGDACIAALPQGLNAYGENYADHNAQPSAAMALRSAGFNMVVTDGNELLAQGGQAVADTAEALYQNGLTACGFNSGNASQLQWLVNGQVKVALISYAESISTKAMNTLQTTAGQGMLTAYDLESLKDMIVTARMNGADFVIVYYRWNDVMVDQVTESMRKNMLEVTAAGADVIIGTGVKRVLPAAWLSTSDDNGITRRALVLYSLGSLLTESREAYDIAGALVHIRLTETPSGGVKIQQMDYTPTYIWKQSIAGKEIYRVVASNEKPPTRMSTSQRGVMERSLGRTNESLENTLILHDQEE